MWGFEFTTYQSLILKNTKWVFDTGLNENLISRPKTRASRAPSLGNSIGWHITDLECIAILEAQLLTSWAPEIVSSINFTESTSHSHRRREEVENIFNSLPPVIFSFLFRDDKWWGRSESKLFLKAS